MVDALQADGGREEELLVGVPLSCENVVAVAGLKACGHGTLTLVDGDATETIEVAEHAVSRYGVALGANEVAADGLLVEDEGLATVHFHGLGSGLLFGSGGLGCAVWLEEVEIATPSALSCLCAQAG